MLFACMSKGKKQKTRPDPTYREVIHEILCINNIDTPSGAEYIVMVKLNEVFSKYERNSG